MDEKKEKAVKIVKSIKLLEGVQKTTSDPKQRGRVKKDLESLRNSLQQMYPSAVVKELEDAIYSETMLAQGNSAGMDHGTHIALRDVEFEQVSPYPSDEEINRAASIMKHFGERVWGVISDQHTKLDFSNSGTRDALYRRLEQCGRSLELFSQTISDIGRSRSPEYSSQLQMMRIKQGRVLLFDLHEFFKEAREFVTSLLSDAEFGGTMVLNHDEIISYADYETHHTFAGFSVAEALKRLRQFIEEALEVINLPEIKKLEKPR
ncbi:MAG TPA: hypothetical protein VLM75_09805 [Spirochaetota bacterium]|nr:hypothetical protein [Spirochaetota bacterium]